MANNIKKKQKKETKNTKLKWDPFSLRNSKYIQNTRKEVLESIGVLTPWQRFKNFPKKLTLDRSIKKEKKSKEKEHKLHKKDKIKNKIIKEKTGKDKAKHKLFFRKDTKKEVINKKDEKIKEKKKQDNKAKVKKKQELKRKKKQELEFMKAKEKELSGIKWKNPEILKTNLIKGDVVIFINWRDNILLLFLGIIFPIILIAGIYQNIMLDKKKQIMKESLLKEKIVRIKQKVKLAKENIKEVTIFQDKVVLIEGLLERHIYWTNFFKFLEDTTIEDVYYSGFSGSTNGVYAFAATADSFNMVTKQIETLREHSKVKLAKTSGGSVGGSAEQSGRVSFSLRLEVYPEIFYRVTVNK